MRTSLTEIREIESHLLNNQSAEDSLVFEARMITDATLNSNVGFQRKLYELLTIFQRRKIKRDILKIHSKLFFNRQKRSFQDHIGRIFNK